MLDARLCRCDVASWFDHGVTNWAYLSDAYGSSERVPSLLAAAGESGAEFGEAWDEVWSRLYHQGTVYSASYAALPLLAELCSRLPARGYMSGLQLAASILASTDGPESNSDVRAAFAAEIAQMRDIAETALRLAVDDTEFIYALEALAAFEDAGVWQRTLNYLADGEAPLACPHCAEELLLQMDEVPPKISTLNAGDDKHYVTACEPATGSREARLVSLAEALGRASVAQSLRFYSGASTCPACGGHLTIARSFA